MKLTHSRLLQVLHYDAETGVFTWKSVTNRRMKKMVGQPAGCLRPDGYLVVGIDGEAYLAHRLAWFWQTGKWPVDEIDHISGVKTENRFANLREANRSENRQNTRLAFSACGILGVSWCKREQKFRATIKLKGKQRSIGYFDAAEDARERYLSAKKVMHPFAVLENSHAS
jgi:hypothetical protein